MLGGTVLHRRDTEDTEGAQRKIPLTFKREAQLREFDECTRSQYEYRDKQEIKPDALWPVSFWRATNNEFFYHHGRGKG